MENFVELSAYGGQDSSPFEMGSNPMININFDFDVALANASRIVLATVNEKNFQAKLGKFFEINGARVVELTHYDQEDLDSSVLDISKFIHLLPNLENFTHFNYTESKSPVSKLAKHSIPLKRLKIDTNAAYKALEIFNIEELELEWDEDASEKNTLNFIKKCANLKRLKVGEIGGESKILSVIAQKSSLESLEFSFDSEEFAFDNDALGKLKSLKSLKLNGVTVAMWTTICESLTNLVSLDVVFCEEISGENMRRVSNLKSLNSLSIGNEMRGQGDFQKLASVSLPNLTSLASHVDINITADDAQAMAANFPALKTLSVIGGNQKSLLPLSMSVFDRVESLNVQLPESWSHGAMVDESFYSASHRNENLKSLSLDVFVVDDEKMLRKMAADFPNLEQIPQHFHDNYREFVKENFKKLKKYSVDLAAVPEPNAELKNRSFALCDTEAAVEDDGQGCATFNFDQYMRWHEMRAMLKSNTRPKSLVLTPVPTNCAPSLDMAVKCLTPIAINVTSVTFTERGTLYQLARIVEALPNLESLKLARFLISDFDGRVQEVKNEKLAKVSLEFRYKDYENKKMRRVANPLETFCEHFRFAEDTLKSFAVIARGLQSKKLKFDARANTKALLERQRLLTALDEHWDEDEDEFFDYRFEARET